MKLSTFIPLSRLLSALLLLAGGAAHAQQVLNVYSARHYPSDDILYAGFTQKTGIQIQRVDSDDAGIIARLRAEGAASPADVILMVDAARLYRGEAMGLFQPVKSAVLDAAIPKHLHGTANAEGAASWYGFSTRARVVVFDPHRVKREDVDTYEELGDPKNKGKLCLRSGSHPYNLSLFGAVLQHLGEAKTEAWLKGMVANMARDPKGGDTDQIRAVAAGECAIAVTNSYYLARLMNSKSPEDRAVADKVEVVFPNQNSWGTHMNIAGAAVAKHAPNRAQAILFLEYLASPEAQEVFSNANNEWPAAQGMKPNNPALQRMVGAGFKSETIPISAVGKNTLQIQQMLDRVGFK
jgi:iron(III) transport system substrate-binding protein